MLLFYFFLFIFGLIAGSFVSMLSWRLPREMSLSGRSKCDKCKKTIPWNYNIPLFGYFLLKGKCFSCKRKISLRYPLIEAFTGISFAVVGFLWINTGSPLLLMFKQNMPILLSFLFFFLFLTSIITLLIVDLEHQILPDVLTLATGGVAVFMLLLLPAPLLFQHLLAGFSAFTFFLFIYLITGGRGMGFGDVKLAFVLGSLLGYPGTLVWLFLSFVSGALVGVLLLLIKKVKPTHEIAFGPYLLFSAIVALFFADQIFSVYLSLL